MGGRREQGEGEKRREEEERGGGGKHEEKGEGRIPVLGPIQGKPDIAPSSKDLTFEGNRVRSESKPPKSNDGGPGKLNKHKKIRI